MARPPLDKARFPKTKPTPGTRLASPAAIGPRSIVALALAFAPLLAACGNMSEDINEAMTEHDNQTEDEDQTEVGGSDGTLTFGEDEPGSGEPGDPQPGKSGGVGHATGSTGTDHPPMSEVMPEALPDVSAPDLAQPEDLIPKLKAAVGEAVQAAADSPDIAILDAADLSTAAPTAEELASFGDGHSRTPTGKLIVLDEIASLACANIEIALGAVDEGDRDTASSHIATAAKRAGQSELAGIRNWSDALKVAGAGESIDATTLVGFLSVCLDGGYVI